MTRTTCVATVLVVLAAVPSVAIAQVSADSSVHTNVDIRWAHLGIGAAVLTAMIVIDVPVARSVHGSMSPGTIRTARQFDRFGDLSGIGPIVGGVALTGLLTHNRKFTMAAAHAIESVALASVIAQAGKHAVGRIRPYGDPDLDATDFSFFSGDPAFPSGHSAAAFAVATSLGDAVDNRWARIGLYGLAAGTGWARMAEEKHWLSDVVAGAALGVISAKFVSGRLRILGMRAPHFVVGPQALGVRWTF